MTDGRACKHKYRFTGAHLSGIKLAQCKVPTWVNVYGNLAMLMVYKIDLFMLRVYLRCSLPGKVALKRTCVRAIDAEGQEGSSHARGSAGWLWR